MTLKFLDDLGQTVGSGALGQQQRFQRLHIIRKTVGQSRFMAGHVLD